MTIQNRIMELAPTTNLIVKDEALEVAKQADSMMAEMYGHIQQLIAAIESDDVIFESLVDRHLASLCCDRYLKYVKEGE